MPHPDAIGAIGTYDHINLRWMMGAALQYRWFIIGITCASVLLATVYVILRPPFYTASTQLQLTNLRLTFVRDDAFFAETQTDPSFLETQVQILRSDRVAKSVLINLHLVPPNASPAEVTEALEKLRGGFFADRAGLSNVVEIRYTASDPERAAQVANEIARAYIAELNTARLDAAKAGTGWLRDRLREVGPKARVIAEALPPKNKGNMRGLLIIAAAGMLGGALSTCAAIAWRLVNPRIVTPEEARSATGGQFLGMVPKVYATVLKFVRRDTQENLESRTFVADHPVLSYALEHPLSEAWHTLRNVRAASEDCFDGSGIKSLGITSTFDGEGRSTISANLALVMAASGKRVLLVDGDVYNPALSRLFATEDCAGLVELVRKDNRMIDDLVFVEQRTGLHFIPIGGGRDLHVRNVWNEDMARFFEESKGAYDYLIFDLPTMSMLGDIRAAARHVDGFLLVIGWGQVSSENIQVGLSAATAVHERLLGAVLNNVNVGETSWALSPQADFLRRKENRVGRRNKRLSAARSAAQKR